MLRKHHIVSLVSQRAPSSMKKNTLIVVASVIVVIGLLVGAYFLFFSDKPAITVGEPNPFIGAGDREPINAPATGPVEGAGTVVAPHLMRITDGPVAHGAVALQITSPQISSSTPALEDTEVRFVERQSGNVYAFRIHDRTLTRISNKTLPGIAEAVWVPDGSRVFARFIANDSGDDRIATYSMEASGGDGYFLEPGLASVGVTGSSTLYTLLSGSNGSVASVARVGDTAIATLFTTALSSISLKPFGGDFVATTRASAEVGGYSFLVQKGSGRFVRALGPFQGLSTLPDPTGKYILYSYIYRGKLLLSVYNMANHTATQLPVATLAEKCVWTPGSTGLYCGIPTALPAGLPDIWYQGVNSFSDRLWRIDMDTRLATLVVDPFAVAEVSIDMVALTMDPVEDALIFTNKADGSLWAYDF